MESEINTTILSDSISFQRLVDSKNYRGQCWQNADNNFKWETLFLGLVCRDQNWSFNHDDFPTLTKRFFCA